MKQAEFRSYLRQGDWDWPFLTASLTRILIVAHLVRPLGVFQALQRRQQRPGAAPRLNRRAELLAIPAADLYAHAAVQGLEGVGELVENLADLQLGQAFDVGRGAKIEKNSIDVVGFQPLTKNKQKCKMFPNNNHGALPRKLDLLHSGAPTLKLQMRSQLLQP